jgi:hypothetical protein
MFLPNIQQTKDFEYFVMVSILRNIHQNLIHNRKIDLTSM